MKIEPLVIIPARGGSKGIPKKNIRKVAGISLIGHVAKLVHANEPLHNAIVSTDSEEIANEAIKRGLSVPFVRPPELASDVAKSVDVWKHSWIEGERFFGREFDVSILLEPTSPMRLYEDISSTVQKLLSFGAKSAVTVSRTPAHFTPNKTLKIDSEHLEFYLRNGDQYNNRQSIPGYYYRNGLCYAATKDAIFKDEKIIGNNTVAHIVDRPVVNIDEPFDLEFADFLFSRTQPCSSFVDE